MVPRQSTGIDLSVQFLIALRRKELVFVGSHDGDDTTIVPMFLHKLRRLISPPEGTGFTARVIILPKITEAAIRGLVCF